MELDKTWTPSEKQRMKLISVTITKVIELTLTNHIYQFDGQVYKQTSGGPIGDDLTRISAK